MFWQGLKDTSALQNLETLSVDGVMMTPEEFSGTLRGRTNLRELRISHRLVNGFNPEIVAAIPESIERLGLPGYMAPLRAAQFFESLSIIGRLPRIRRLEISCEVMLDDVMRSYGGDFGWSNLLPAASRLTHLRIHYLDSTDATFLAFVPSLEKVERLEFPKAFGNCEGLLCSISCLPSLKSLLLQNIRFRYRPPPLYLDSEFGLLSLIEGKTRYSLESCIIQLAVEDEGLRANFLECFNEHVEPCFECEVVGYRSFEASLIGGISSEEEIDEDEEDWDQDDWGEESEDGSEQDDEEVDAEDGKEDGGEDGG